MFVHVTREPLESEPRQWWQVGVFVVVALVYSGFRIDGPAERIAEPAELVDLIHTRRDIVQRKRIGNLASVAKKVGDNTAGINQLCRGGLAYLLMLGRI